MMKIIALLLAVVVSCLSLNLIAAEVSSDNQKFAHISLLTTVLNYCLEATPSPNKTADKHYHQRILQWVNQDLTAIGYSSVQIYKHLIRLTSDHNREVQ